MQELLSRRLHVAWLLMFIILLASVGIMLILISQGAAPSNAVLIESLEDEEKATLSAPQTISGPSASPTLLTSAQPGTTPTPASLAIYLSGAVQEPGVYTLPVGSRVNDALKAAGGATGEADLEQINLSAYVSDLEHVRVPKIGEIMEAARPTPQAHTQSTASSTARSISLAPGEKLDLNSATALELEALPGIGPVLAARIVTDRDTNGPFGSVDDLMRVPGIKEGLLSRFREYVTVSP